jgi:hypothetical protein
VGPKGKQAGCSLQTATQSELCEAIGNLVEHWPKGQPKKGSIKVIINVGKEMVPWLLATDKVNNFRPRRHCKALQ